MDEGKGAGRRKGGQEEEGSSPIPAITHTGPQGDTGPPHSGRSPSQHQTDPRSSQTSEEQARDLAMSMQSRAGPRDA